MVLQLTTREIWAAQGPFEPYPLTGTSNQNVPALFIKGASWRTVNGNERYYAQSSAPEESGLRSWYPVEFNSEHICWVEVRWVEPVEGQGYWQVFRIAGEDLGLDIRQQELIDQD